MYYPSYLFSIREDVTRRNLAAYDAAQEKIYQECLKRRPDYHNMPCRERVALRENVAADLNLNF